MTALARAHVEQDIKDLLCTQFGVDAAFVAACDSATPLLGHGIGLDSIEVMALALGIESRFAIEIPDEDLTAALFENIGSLTDYILQKSK